MMKISDWDTLLQINLIIKLTKTQTISYNTMRDLNAQFATIIVDVIN